MDQSLRELQRHCDSNPGDLASGERLFNHYLRLGDPVFLEISQFIEKKSPQQELQDLQALLEKLPDDRLQWTWLTAFVKKKIENWPQKFFVMSGVKFRRFPDSTALDKIHGFISEIHFYFDDSSNSEAQFTRICSIFNTVQHFRLVLANRDYNQLKDCFPEKIDHLALSGNLEAVNSMLKAVQNKKLASLELRLEGQSYPPTRLKIAPKTSKYLVSLKIDGHALTTPIRYCAIETIIENSAVNLQELSLKNLRLSESILYRITSALCFPVLKSFLSMYNDLGSIPTLLRSKFESDRNQLRRLFLIDSSVTVSHLANIGQYLNLSNIDSAWIAIEGGSNCEIQELFDRTGILNCPQLDFRISQVSGALDYTWLERRASFGLERLDINLEADRELPEIEEAELNALKKRLLTNRRFPNLKILNLGLYSEE